MATNVCSGPPINFDIARFKTDGVIFITMMNFQAQTFRNDLLQKYDYLKITQQQAYQLQEIPEEYANMHQNANQYNGHQF